MKGHKVHMAAGTIDVEENLVEHCRAPLAMFETDYILENTRWHCAKGGGSRTRSNEPQWISGSVQQWISGSVQQWISGALQQWISGSVQQWISGAVQQWISGSVQDCCTRCAAVHAVQVTTRRR